MSDRSHIGILDYVGVYGRIASPINGPMDSVQVVKAVFVNVYFTSLGFEPRTCECAT